MDRKQVYHTSVDPAWIDHNGHMNVAYYVLAFDQATDAAYENWGIGIDYPGTSGCSVFTLGMNVDYVNELFADDRIRITTTLVDFDHKRVHYLHKMYNDQSSLLAASNECLGMNVNLNTRKSADFSESVVRRLETAVNRELESEHVGRVLSIRRKE